MLQRVGMDDQVERASREWQVHHVALRVRREPVTRQLAKDGMQRSRFVNLEYPQARLPRCSDEVRQGFVEVSETDDCPCKGNRTYVGETCNASHPLLNVDVVRLVLGEAPG